MVVQGSPYRCCSWAAGVLPVGEQRRCHLLSVLPQLAQAAGERRAPIQMQKGEKQSSKSSVRMLGLGNVGLGEEQKDWPRRHTGMELVETGCGWSRAEEQKKLKRWRCL